MSRELLYSPLDELLDRRDVRILRALRHFDAVDSTELRDMLGLTSDADRQAAWRATRKLVAQRAVEQRGRLLRITERGVSLLEKTLAKAIPRAQARRSA